MNLAHNYSRNCMKARYKRQLLALSTTISEFKGEIDLSSA